jgi:membrane protein implicated in regulation of membrane protease activity
LYVKVSFVQMLVGGTLLAWCGVNLALGLAMSLRVEMSLVGFALAIVIIAAAPARALSRRVARLEAQVASSDAR